MSAHEDQSPATQPDPASAAVRRGRISWLTGPPSGTAYVGAEREGLVESSAFHALPVSLRDGGPDPDAATPGEVLAIAYASFMASALAETLSVAGSPARELTVEAVCRFAGPLPVRELVALDLDVDGRVPGIDSVTFTHAAEDARRQSLRSTGARDDLPGTLEAELLSLYE